MIEERLRNYLLADTAIATALAQRLYYDLAPEGTPVYPYLVLMRVSTPRLRSLSGPSGLANPRVQVTLISDDPLTLVDLTDLVRRRLDGPHAYPLNLDGATVRSMLIEDEDGKILPSADNAEIREYVRRLDVLLWHDET